MVKPNEIYNIDCFQAFESMEDKSVDFMLTSPPFREEDVPGDYWGFYDRFMKEVKRLTRDYAIIFHSSTKLIEIIKRYSAPYRVMVWTKLPNMTTFRYEPILIYRFTDQYKLNRYIWKDVFHYSPVSNREHPYENPLKLYLDVVKMIPGEKIILDPFLGSGTTALACKTTGHSYIGFEIDQEYYQIAASRLDRIKRQTMLEVVSV